LIFPIVIVILGVFTLVIRKRLLRLKKAKDERLAKEREQKARELPKVDPKDEKKEGQ